MTARRTLLLGLLCLLGPLCRAQNLTVVTGTVTDSGSTPYVNGSLTVSFSNTSGQQALFGGNANFQQTYSAALNSSGAFSITLPSNAVITPSGTQWKFGICASDGGSCFSSLITISGGSQDVSATLSAAAPRITFANLTRFPLGGNGQDIQTNGSAFSWGSVSSLGTNNIFTGNNTHSGTETFTGPVTIGKWNSVISVDGVQFTTCDAAVTAAVAQAGSGLALVIVPSTYAGAACTTIPTNNHVQVWYFNNIDPLVQSGIFWNTTSATPVNAWFRPQVNFASPTANSLSVYAISRFSGVIPSSSAMDAGSHEAQSVGAITSVGAGTKLQGEETVVTLASTGSTWPDVRATVSYVQDIASNTTNATNVSGLFIPTFNKVGTGSWATVVGAIFNKQTVGSTASWAMQSFGSSLFSFNQANEKLFISGDSFTNSNVIDIADTHAGGHTWDIGEMQNVAHLSFRDISQTGGPAWSFLLTGTTGVEGILSHANTVNRTYTFLDASGTVAFNPPAATGTDLGSTSLPWANLWLGTAATNNFKFQPAATAAARTINLWDFGANGPSTQNYPGLTILTSQYTNSTATFTNVAGGNTLQFPVLANTTYTAECHLYYQAAATGGLNIEFTGPASPTNVIYGLNDPSAATTFNSSVATAYSTALGAVVGTAATNFDAVVSFSLINGTNAGTVNLLARSSAAVQLQIQAGSFCKVQ